MEKYTLDRSQACIVLFALSNELRACRRRIEEAREWQAETGDPTRLDYEKRMLYDTMRLRDRLRYQVKAAVWKSAGLAD